MKKILKKSLISLIIFSFIFIFSNIVLAEHNYCEYFPEGSGQCIGACIGGGRVATQGGYDPYGEYGCQGCNSQCSRNCGAQCESGNDCASGRCDTGSCQCESCAGWNEPDGS